MIKGKYLLLGVLTALHILSTPASLQAQNLSNILEMVNSQKKLSTTQIERESTKQSNTDTANKEKKTLEISKIEAIYNPIISEKVDNIRAISGDNDKANNLIHNQLISQFGYALFNNDTDHNFFEERISVGGNYILGPGDVLKISIWGKLDEQFELEIDNNGQIFMPKVGSLSIAGESLKRARSLIKKALSKHYVNLNYNIMLKSLRKIKILIMGEVTYPGSYNISSLTSPFNALYLAKGPTKLGSLRNIQVIRGGKIVKTIDLYNNLLSGKQIKTIRLLENDVLFIPTIKETLKLTGAIKREHIFEMRKKTTLYDAVHKLGGGLIPLPIQYKIQVTRITKAGARKNLVFDYNNSIKKEIIHNGDQIHIFKAKTKAIQLLGEVQYPGTYIIQENEKLEDIIIKAGGFTKNAFLDGAILKRKNTFRSLLNEKSSLINKEQEELQFDQLKLTMTQRKKSELDNALLREIEDLNFGRIGINLKENQKIRLEDQDTLTIPTIPQEIQVFGGINRPLALLYTPNKRVSHYIKQCGNFSEYATKQVLIIKANGQIADKNTIIEPGDMIYAQQTFRQYIDWLDVLTKVVDITFKTVTTYRLATNL